MTNRMIVIKANGVEDYTVCKEVPTLEELQAAVGGLIEAVPFFNEYKGNPCVAFCNEEGKLMGMKRNEKATELWHDIVRTPDYLVGDICIVTGDAAFLAAL